MLRPARAAVVSAVLLLARTSSAQSSSEIAAAKEWFAEGIKLETDGKWKDALDRFKRAQGVKHTPQIDFHVGLCEERTGDLVSAIVDLDRAVASAREKHDDKVIAAASSELADVRARTPTLEIDAPSDKAQRVLVDGASFALSALGSPVPMNPGEHAVVVEFTTGRAEKKVTLAERDAKKIALEPPVGSTAVAAPVPAPASEPAPAPASEPAAAPASASSSSGSKLVPWLLVGGGGVLVVGGVVFYAMAQSEASTLDGACPSRVHCDPSLQSHADSGKTDTTLAFVLGGVGLATAAVGAGMLVFGGGSSREAQAVLVPSALPGGGGASVVGRF